MIEIIGGLLTNSVAILSDALHDFGDSLSLGIAWYFQRISGRKENQEFTYGYTRFSVLGAVINSIILFGGSIFIMIEAIPRLLEPKTPETIGMIYLSIGGIIVNGVAAFRLSRGSSLNEKVVYLHLLEDILGWVAVLIGAIVMHFYDVPILDPLLSIGIALFILFNIYKNLKESFRIILQATPSNLSIDAIHQTLENIPDVKSFHDCHTWTMDGEFNILSVHLVVDSKRSMNDLETIKKTTKERLKTIGIDHATIEFETIEEDCDPC